MDRFNKLPLGEINLDMNCFGESNSGAIACYRDFFPNGISMAGYAYLMPTHKDSVILFESIAETIFEYVRRIYFNEKPSRYQSIFACETMEDVKNWDRYFNCNGNFIVKKLEFESCFKGDIAWRDHALVVSDGNGNVCNGFNTALLYSCAKQYWSGVISPNPRLELVIPLPVLVLE